MNPRNPGETASRPTLIILMLAAVAGLASLATSIANITLPALSEDFSAPFAQVQGVVAAYLAALTLSVLLAGRLGDRFGMKPMLMLGVSLFAVASLASSLAPNLSLLIAARVVQGIGAALMMTLTMALMRQNAGETHLGRAMGLLGTVSAVGRRLGRHWAGCCCLSGAGAVLSAFWRPWLCLRSCWLGWHCLEMGPREMSLPQRGAPSWTDG